MEELVDLNKQRDWEGPPGEVKIPEVYIKDLRYEIVVFTRKERGGSDFMFRCREYSQTSNGHWSFHGVISDSSIKNPSGEVVTARFSYHPEVALVNVGFMVYPALSDAGSSTRS